MATKGKDAGAPYAGKPRVDASAFGGDGATAIERHGGDAIDMRSVADWKSVLGVDCSEYAWGQVIITGEARMSKIPPPQLAAAPEFWTWVEVRIVADINGQRIILLEAAVGNHGEAAIGDSSKSAGPVLLAFAPGEVPDRVEVHARARRGGVAQTSHIRDEVLTLTPCTRFHT
jgi:hypothetical protein